MADKRKKMDMYDFPEHDCTRSKTVAHTFIPSLDNANGRLRQERLFRSRNFATTSHFPSLFNASLYYLSAWKSRAKFKVPIYPVDQSLNQPLVEPFENNLKQNSSIKWLFQHTLGIILDHLSESANSAPKEIFWIYSVNKVIAKKSILTTRNWEHFLSPIFNFNFPISSKHVILIDTQN